MNARARNLLRGAGAIMDLAPNRDLRQMAPRRTGAERMAAHFARVGESVTRACGTFGGDGNTDTTEAKAA
jgi:hypothetical protein